MAEATHPGVRGPSAQSLLATKLHVPRLKPGFVARQRLIDQLNDGLTDASRLCVPHRDSARPLCSPTGVRGARIRSRGCRSIRPTTIRRGSGATWPPRSIGRCRGSATGRALGGGAFGVTRRPDDDPDQRAQRGPNEPRDRPRDYHVIDVERIHAAVQLLLEHAPDDVHVVLTSRADPPLALARLRASGRLDELRAVDLRFTRSEAADLFAQSIGAESPRCRDEGVDRPDRGLGRLPPACGPVVA